MSDPSIVEEDGSRGMRSGSVAGASTGSAAAGAPQERQQDRLIVGVDFGTTYSGVAAVYTSTPEDVEVIKTWPGGNGITSDKVPTEISYITPPGATSVQANKWGFQFKPEEERLRCIKLFLDRNQKLPHFVSPLETAAQLRKYNKNVVVDVNIALQSNCLHRLIRVSVRVISEMMAIYSNMIISRVHFDGEMEVFRMMKRVFVTNFWSPHPIELRIHDNDVLVVETKVDMENNVWSAEQFDCKILVMPVTDMPINGDVGPILKWFEDGKSCWDTWIVIGVHVA